MSFECMQSCIEIGVLVSEKTPDMKRMDNRIYQLDIQFEFGQN